MTTHRLTPEKINARLEPRGLRMIGPYKNNKAPTLFLCLKGEHEFMARPYSLFQGNGCRICGNKETFTMEKINERLAPRGYKMLEPVKNTKSRSLFQCPEGHQWRTTVHCLLYNGACPACSSSGFDVGKPAELYVFKTRTRCNRVCYGVGITNRTFEERYSVGEHRLMTLLTRVNLSTGEDAIVLERAIKRNNARWLLPEGVKTQLREKGSLTRSTEIFSRRPQL